jgi:ribosomal protein S18 acetylase RimI-like enzyme
MQVRQLRPSDAPAAQELLKQLGYDVDINDLARRIDRVLATENHFGAVAEDHGKIVGLMHVYERPALEKPREAVVQSLIVDSKLRSMGIGRTLMAAAEAWARTNGLAHVVLHTRIDRDDAHTFYERLGYGWAATSHLMRKQIEGA